jgi:hypothetical protein
MGHHKTLAAKRRMQRGIKVLAKLAKRAKKLKNQESKKAGGGAASKSPA